MTPIYFDHAATTPMSTESIRIFVEAASAGPGNPSSVHAAGRAARASLTASRDTFAKLLGCTPAELVFTSGGTESDNLAITGAARAALKRGRNRIVTSAIEHHAVLHTCEQLAREGFELIVLPVDEQGVVSVQAARDAINEHTAVVSIMAGNNETGVIQPIEEIGELARANQALMHVDAVQAFGYIPLDTSRMPIDLLSLSAHKVNGPQGVGLLYARKGIHVQSLLYGGSQERNRRAGTENVAGIASFAAAAEHAILHIGDRVQHAHLIRDTFLGALNAHMPPEALHLNGDADNRLPHIVNISFQGASAESMLMNLDLAGVCASGGSACTAGSIQPSHVLSAMKISSEKLRSAVRFSFGLGNTREEAEKAAKIVATIWARIRIC